MAGSEQASTCKTKPEMHTETRRTPRRAERQDQRRPGEWGSLFRELARWLALNLELTLAIGSGAFLAAGFFGELLLALPEAAVLGLYAVAYVTGGYDAAKNAFKTLVRLRFDIDVLMVVAALGATVLGEYAEGALLLFLFSLGHALEHQAMDRARKAIRALGELTPKTARIADEQGEREIPVDQLQIEQTVVVRAGERLPVDGIVIDGASAVDQSPVTKPSSDTTLARVIDMVEEAESQQSPSRRFTERFTRIFVPSVLVVVVLVITLPPLFGVLAWAEAFLRGMTVLVAASPCALAISTPAAVLSAVARAARGGVLLKGGMHLENLGTLRSIAFDKTGTITTGTFEVTDIVGAEGVAEDELLSTVAAVEGGSSHPLAEAVTREAERRGVSGAGATEVTSEGGRGISGTVDSTLVRVGNRRLFSDLGLSPEIDATLERREAQGKSCMIARREESFLGVVALRDRPRENAAPSLAALRALGIERTILITGDNERVAKAVSAEVGMDDYRAGLLPEQKVEAIKELKARYGAVAMVGDGVNDAPAMASSTVGIAMGAGGTDVALETADVALMGDDLSRLSFAVRLSRRARLTIVQNLAISLGVIGVLVVAALTGMVSIAPVIIVHEGSTLVVVANALRLLRLREE